MSISGIRSNRGDSYQTLVAFDWALSVLSESNYQWLEIDSVSYSVDDVVVGKADGTLICCQCKKNQIDFRAWSISDLADELIKASRLLAANEHAEVRFYSRSPFGVLAKLREHSATQPNEVNYQASLPEGLRNTDTTLSELLAGCSSGLSTYEFLNRTKFESTAEMDSQERMLRERLRSIASNPVAAFDALWVRLDQLGAHLDGENISAATQHRLTKGDLEGVLFRAGALLAPPINIEEVLSSFNGTSAIGRTWRRDISGERIPSPSVTELLSAVDAKKHSILLTGKPGSGKTCVLLELQEILEQRTQSGLGIVPLFIQSREFADLSTAQDRQAQGLSEQWVEKAARLAESARVIVVIDSLDVLSIARDHQVLTYFLAQIDRLLLVPNVTVITACRDFDRQYDRRISERHWDCELRCQPLDWDAEILPLLEALGIATTVIGSVTRELIRNPRELAMFVELAQREGEFNVVTSQALAQRYLDTIVRANDALGNEAMQSIESLAAEMLKSRSLAVRHQRFTASQEIQRELCSLNVLQETRDGKLTFGHQTLLDVLVISGATRTGVTLNEFIQSLPPVPFVRPSIRSFVAQLALGERQEFRTQLRAVLTGRAAFHIRRLVAESFAEQIPQNDDWPLIRHLYTNHRDVFQVIYFSAKTIEWHYFWLDTLVPFLEAMRDAEGFNAHAYRIAQWSNEDSAGVVAFWMRMLSFDWIDSNGIADKLGIHLSDIKMENLSPVVPLLERLLELPRSEYSMLGKVVARCLASGLADDSVLWSYIVDGVSKEDVLGFAFDNKLHCQAYELDDQNNSFLSQRMEQSNVLLDLALESIEHWSDMRASRFDGTHVGYRQGFLGETSYDDVHSRKGLGLGLGHKDSMNILLDAVEDAVLHHARSNSEWWITNRERLCFNHEGSLLYFAILACTASPEANIDLIGRMLIDKNMLEFEFTYELGSLIKSTFNLLDPSMQDAVVTNILSVWDEVLTDDESRYFWVLKKRAELSVAIPCHLRSREVQAVLDAYEQEAGVLIRQPDIHSQSGVVSAPFSDEVFLGASNSGVLVLLDHYNGYSDSHQFGADFLVGGERHVGAQLRQASSRHPTRFLGLLSIHWEDIPERFRDDIMDGVATHLAYRYGNLQINGTWEPVEEPDATALANQILDELERHTQHWQHRRSTAKALEACANVIYDEQHAERLVFLAIGFGKHGEDDATMGDAIDLLTHGINMKKGNVAEALMILATNLRKHGSVFPELLAPTLRRFATDEHPAIRALILRRLPFLQSKDFELGWDVFHHAMRDADRLWPIAEPCLYYAYHNHFEVVSPLLARIRSEGNGKDLTTWARISALAAMDGYIDFDKLLESLKTLESKEAWHGAAAVWTNSENIRLHREQCLAGIEEGLKAGVTHGLAVAEQLNHLFRDVTPLISVPIELIRLCFSVFENDVENKHHQLVWFHEWLNATSQYDPEQALSATEVYLTYVSHSVPFLYDHGKNIPQLITRLFAEAEEREESDNGAMLQRVVTVQDRLLSLGMNGVNDWLKAAERP